MSLVPSHDCFLLKEPSGNTRLPIDSHRSISLFRSGHVFLGLVQHEDRSICCRIDFLFLTSAQFICSRDVTGQTIHPRAQPGGIYDILQEMAVVSCSAGIGNRRGDDPVAGSHLA